MVWAREGMGNYSLLKQGIKMPQIFELLGAKSLEVIKKGKGVLQSRARSELKVLISDKQIKERENRQVNSFHTKDLERRLQEMGYVGRLGVPGTERRRK